jgi:hypothetical protein
MSVFMGGAMRAVIEQALGLGAAARDATDAEELSLDDLDDGAEKAAAAAAVAAGFSQEVQCPSHTRNPTYLFFLGRVCFHHWIYIHLMAQSMERAMANRACEHFRSDGAST